MSVPKTKRGEGQLVVLTKAYELAEYSIKICKNEKHFPKSYRWCLTSKIVDSAVSIYTKIRQSNAIFVQNADDYAVRRKGLGQNWYRENLKFPLLYKLS